MWGFVGTAGKPSRAHGELPPLLLRLTNFLGYLFLILVNILSSTGAFGGTNAEISRKFPTPLTPAGWAFSIWGIIFALEGAGVVYQIINKGYREGGWKASVVTKIGYGWQLGWLCQDAWQFFFVLESVPGMWLAALALLAALAAFQVTLHRLNGTTHELRARGYAGMPAAAYIFYKLPTAINAAWLSVAAALGVLIVPVAYGVPQARLVPLAAVLTVLVTAGGIWRLAFHRDAAYGLTLIWALAAVASNSSANVPSAVKIVGIVCLAALALFVVAALVRTHRALASAANPAVGADAGFMHDTSYGTYAAPYHGPYGSYSDRRVLLSDSDAFAGAGGGGVETESGSGYGGGGGETAAVGRDGGGAYGSSGGYGGGGGGAGGFGGQAASQAQGVGAGTGNTPVAVAVAPGEASASGSCRGSFGNGEAPAAPMTTVALRSAGSGLAPAAWGGRPVAHLAPGGTAPLGAAGGGVGGAGSGVAGGSGRRVRFQLDDEEAGVGGVQ